MLDAQFCKACYFNMQVFLQRLFLLLFLLQICSQYVTGTQCICYNVHNMTICESYIMS